MITALPDILRESALGVFFRKFFVKCVRENITKCCNDRKNIVTLHRKTPQRALAPDRLICIRGVAQSG